MRFRRLVGVILIYACPSILGGAPAATARQFPYTAHISEDNVYVRSGPGKNYYPTDKMSQGAKVEVYRHDPGGWCVVRPPEGSFSWVAARYVEPRERGLGVVTSDNVAARIGCVFSDQRDVIHIRLYRGQVVRILGQKQFGTGRSGLWYQIAPPPGEFRWVHGKYVDPNYETSGLSDPAQTAASPASHASDTASAPHAAASRPERSASAPQEASDVATATHWGSADETAAVAPASAVGTAEPPGLLPSPVRSGSLEQESSGGRAEASLRGVASIYAPNADDDPVTRRVKQLKLDLAIMLAEEPTVWRFEELLFQAEQLLSNAETALQRGRVRLLIEAIDRSREVKERYEAVGRLRQETDHQNRRLAALGQVRGASVTSEDAGGATTFDAMGYLWRNPEAGPNDPPYLLLDARGQPLCYVAPAPGVNLEYFVQRGAVGLNGVLTYRADQARLLQAREAFPVASVREDR